MQKPMNLEFHYYITKGIALRSGYTEPEAEIIGYSAQFVDDNLHSFEVKTGEGKYFTSEPTQTWNILKPQRELSHIYVCFHFIPGEPYRVEHERADGSMHLFNCTPDSPNARAILKAALDSQNLYRIGIALHAYADTWAHQNFTGTHHSFNAFSSPTKTLIPDIGHADAGHAPDLIGATWTDPRLVRANITINNNDRFLSASKRIFEELSLANGKSVQQIRKAWPKLEQDLKMCFHRKGEKTKDILHRRKHIESLLGVTTEYDPKQWIQEALEERNWKGQIFYVARKGFKTSHWRSFQKAALQYHDFASKLLEKQFNRRDV